MMQLISDFEWKMQYQKFWSIDKSLVERRRHIWWSVKESCTVLGWNNFLPDLPEGDEHFTLQKFLQVLRNQHNQPLNKQNSEVIDRMMRKTFSHRWKLLVKDLVRLIELIQIYPVFCSEKQACFFFFS